MAIEKENGYSPHRVNGRLQEAVNGHRTSNPQPASDVSDRVVRQQQDFTNFLLDGKEELVVISQNREFSQEDEG
jgi:hypothetical protein